MKITRRQLRRLIRESVDENEDIATIAKLNAWIDSISSNKVQMNYGSSISWEQGGTEEDWNQLWEVVEMLYPDQIPPTLKLWDATTWQGEILNDPEFMTQEQARTLHLRVPVIYEWEKGQKVEKQLVPVDEDNNEVSEPVMPSWSNRTYLYGSK